VNAPTEKEREYLCRLYAVAYSQGHHDTVEACYRDVQHHDFMEHADAVGEFLKESPPPREPSAKRCHLPDCPHGADCIHAKEQPRETGDDMLDIAARLLRHHAADAHDEDVQDIARWLAVYDSRAARLAPTTTGEQR
jgi:hypothetical protein